jgi:hypothetical protein
MIEPVAKNIKTTSCGGHACDPSTQEAEAGGAWIPGHPWLHSKTPFQKQSQKYVRKIIITIFNIFTKV